MKTLGSGGPTLEPLWAGPCQVILSSPTAVKVPGIGSWVITLELRGDTLTRTKWLHLISLLSMLWLCTFQMSLITYVSLLLLTPKVLSLPFDPQDNAFLFWAHSYAALHSQTAGSVEHSPLHQWKASRGRHLHFKEKTFSKSVNTFDNNHMRCFFSSDDTYQP